MDNKNIYKILLEKKIPDPEYFKKYYHLSTLSDRVICDLCGRSASVQKLYRHKKSKLCTKNCI
jgi:hypothetical protein